MDFVRCHACDIMMDVSKAGYIFESNPEKQTIRHICEKCGSISTLVISMVYGLTSVERIVKLK